MLRDLGRDLLHGLRLVRRGPLFAALVVITLGLGIGANTAIFSLVNALLLRPLPVRDPGQLVLLSSGNSSGRSMGLPSNESGRVQLFSYPLYQMLRSATPDLQLAGQDSNAEASIVIGKTPSEDRASGRGVSANFFEVLGVVAQRGRVFLPEDETSPGADRVVVLSDGYWRRRFGADPAVVGSSLTINGTAYSVVGVARSGFTGAETGSATDFWVPITMNELFTRFGVDIRDPGFAWMQLWARLRPEASLAAAQAAANVVLRRFLEVHPEVSPQRGPRDRAHVDLESARGGISPTRSNFRQPLLVLMAAVGLLLLVVSLNVSHLLLARAVNRRYELGVRAALGASRGRLVRQLLAEALLLAVMGAAVGLLLRRWLEDGLVTMVAGRQMSEGLVLDLGADGRVAWFVAGVAAGTALILGIVPAWAALRGDLQSQLRASAPTLAGRRLTGRILLSSQVAFSLVLLVGAGLLGGTLGRLRQVASGFDEEHVLLASLNIPMAGLDDAGAVRYYRELATRVAALPGVRAASLATPDPLSGGNLRWSIGFPGTDRPTSVTKFYIVTPDYFEAVGLRLQRGRPLAYSDDAGAPRVVIVNEAMARSTLAGSEAIGQRITLDGQHDVTVVGVVSDSRTDGLREPAPPAFYLPAAQPHGLPAVLRLSGLEVRGTGDAAQLTSAVRRAVHEVNAGVPILGVRTMRAQVDRSLGDERLLATLAGAFGLAALFLVAVGLYGVIGQWATQRTREIGLRMALGASGPGVRWLVLRQAFLLVAIGVAAGVPAALGASRLLTGLLWGVPPMHPPTVAAASLALFLVAALAAYLPARRASRVDPMTALRSD